MRWLLVLLVGVLGGVIGALAVLSRLAWWRAAPPPPQMAAPKGNPDCGIPPHPATPTPFGGPVNGGTFYAQQISIPAGMTLSVLSDLTLVTDDLLRVDGSIVVPPAAPPGTPPVNITLVSKQGNVVIGPTGVVGQPWLGGVQAAAGVPSTVTAMNALAASGAASHAGWIKIVAALGSVDVLGTVSALGGGVGGTATATGLAGAWGRGGSATAVAGQGGAGGDVLLCAYEAIHFGPGAFVAAGLGGSGGIATATAVNGDDAYAEGAPATTAAACG